ncbi:rod shape-determining protein RodA [Oligella ureolytica]
MMKLAMPLMLAWYFDRYRNNLSLMDYVVATILLMVPFALIIKQPDLGTALLVLASGLVVIYFAGLSFKLIVPVFVIGVTALTLVITYQDVLCAPGFDWVILHEYQKGRVCTLMDPTTDPLGKGFHTIQAMIAIGSGGIYGKGYRGLCSATASHDAHVLVAKHIGFVQSYSLIIKIYYDG